jgi:two-component system, chemotaxis family, protein-glutamate methylesterase/glutaminase
MRMSDCCRSCRQIWGVAIVTVNHMRNVATLLHQILPKHAAMPVMLIADGMPIRVDCAFIIPERTDLHLHNGRFRLAAISKPRGWPDLITVFLRSLARNLKGPLAVVIVSGLDGDGAAALRGSKAIGGITIAQDPISAKQPDMPISAIGTGFVDFILTPEKIGQTIAALAHEKSALRTKQLRAAAYA